MLLAMTLKQYLKHHKIKGFFFAKKIGRSPSTVSRLINGASQPDSVTMKRIIKVTKGQVQPNDMYL